MNFKSKVQCLLQHMHDSGGGNYMEFRFISSSDYSICHATNAIEFEEILDFAQENRWLKWRKRDPMSGGRTVYHGTQLTHQGMEKIIQESPMMFADFPACPLTGLPLKEQATFTPLNGSAQVLYAFKPIGQAIFERDHLIGLGKAITAGNHRLHPDIAGLCREATERGEPALVMTYKMFVESQNTGPTSFEDKRIHFLRLLWETGGNEYRERTINTFEDFPMAFATDADQFFRILKSLLEEGLIKYASKQVVSGDWVKGIQAHYHDVLPTAAVKHFLDSKKLDVAVAQHAVPISLASLHPTVQSAASSRFASAHYSDAIQKACTALEKAVQVKSGLPTTTTGASVMTTAFSKNNALIHVADDPNEQFGFMALYQGAVMALRNHFAHSLSELTDPNRALEWLSFISALFYKLDEAKQETRLILDSSHSTSPKPPR